MKPTKKQKIIALTIFIALAAAVVVYAIVNKNTSLFKGEFTTNSCSEDRCDGNLYVNLTDDNGTVKQLRYNQEPSTILNVRLNASEDDIRINELSLNFSPHKPDIKNIKFSQQIAGEAPKDIPELQLQNIGGENSINIRIPNAIYISKDSYVNFLVTAQSNDNANPTGQFHLNLIRAYGYYKGQKSDCTDENYDNIDDDNNESCDISFKDRGFGEEGDGLIGPMFQIMPGSLRMASSSWPTPTIIAQNRTGIQLGEIKATSTGGTTEIKGVNINFAFPEDNPGAANIIKNLKVRGALRVQSEPQAAPQPDASGIESPAPPSDAEIELRNTSSPSGNTLAVNFDPPLIIKNNSTETIKFIGDLDESARPTEFSPIIEANTDIIGNGENNNDDVNFYDFFKEILGDFPLKIGPTVKVPATLTVTAPTNTPQQLPYYIENQELTEIARFKLTSDHPLKISKITLSAKDDVGASRLPFSKIKETETFQLNSRSLEESICTTAPDYIGKKVVINCGIDNPIGFTENALEKTIIIKAKLDSGLILGQKFALVLKSAVDIVSNVPETPNGLPVTGPIFTITNVADVEVSAAGEAITLVPSGEPKFTKLITVKFDIRGGDSNIVKKVKKITIAKTDASNFANEKIGEFRLLKKDGTDLSANALLNNIAQDTNGTIPIEFQTGEGENYTVISSGLEFTLAANLNPLGADKDKILQYKITNVELEPSGVNKIIVQADGPKITFGDRACPNGKKEKTDGTCECPQSPTMTYDYTEQPTFYSRLNGNVCVPCNPDDLVTSDGVLICPQDKVAKPGTLTITTKLPDGQNTNIPFDEATIKAIEIDFSKQGGDLLGDKLKHFDLVFEGDFNTNLIYEPELFIVSGTQKTQLTDEQVELKYSTTNGIINADFTTPQIIGESKKLILYLKTNAIETDTGKKFRYKVSGVETDPSSPISKVYMNGDASQGPQFIVPNKPALTVINNIINDNNGTGTPNDFPLLINDEDAVYGANVLGAGIYTVKQTNNPQYTVSTWSGDCSADGKVTMAAGDNKTCTITNDDIALPYCESIEKHTYKGKDIPGLLYGNCIDCPNDMFNSLSGRCEVTKVATEGGGDVGEQNSQDSDNTDTQTDQDSSPPPDTTQQSQAIYTQTPSDNSRPDLRGSARLVAIPDRGNTGPGIVIYFGAIAATYAVMQLRKRKKK